MYHNDGVSAPERFCDVISSCGGNAFSVLSLSESVFTA